MKSFYDVVGRFYVCVHEIERFFIRQIVRCLVSYHYSFDVDLDQSYYTIFSHLSNQWRWRTKQTVEKVMNNHGKMLILNHNIFSFGFHRVKQFSKPHKGKNCFNDDGFRYQQENCFLYQFFIYGIKTL